MIAAESRDPRKILLALQFWEGDKEKAMHLARLIADIEPCPSKIADFVFFARFDAKHDIPTAAHVGQKFRTEILTSTRQGTGWPDGCNDMAIDLLQQAGYKSKPGRPWRDYKALYLMESDNMPMCKDWLQRISDEWDAAGKMVMGAWSPFHSPFGHINGNMLVRPGIAVQIPGLDFVPVRAGWDAYFGDKFKDVWHKSVQMQNHYDYRSDIPPEILFSKVDGVTPPAVVHGVKDGSAERQVRRFLFA